MNRIRLHESVASLPATSEGNGIFDVTVIRPGWGSSGYYSEAMLAEYGPKVFTKGRPMFANHPTEAEFANGRDVTKIMAKLYEDARWEDGVVKAKIKVGAPYREFVEDYMETIGLSIFAEGEGQTGEAEGRRGLIVESLNADDRYASLDFVVAAGAGGKVEQKLLESFRQAEASAESGTPSGGRRTQSKENSMEIEDVAKKVDLLAEALSAFVKEATPLLESLKPDENPEVVDMAASIEAVIEAKLPKASRKAVLESVTAGVKIEDAILSEKARVDEIRKELAESVKPAAGGAPAGRASGDNGESAFSMKKIGEKA